MYWAFQFPLNTVVFELVSFPVSFPDSLYGTTLLPSYWGVLQEVGGGLGTRLSLLQMKPLLVSEPAGCEFLHSQLVVLSTMLLLTASVQRKVQLELDEAQLRVNNI